MAVFIIMNMRQICQAGLIISMYYSIFAARALWAFKTRSSSHVSHELISVCMVHKKKLTCGENGLSLFPRGLEPDKHKNCLLATSMC